MPIVDDLERLAGLHRGGVLTDQEFTEAKRKLFATADVPGATRGDAPHPPDGYSSGRREPEPMSAPAYRPAGFGRPPVQLAATDRANNPAALTGFILGLVSMVLYYLMLFPILAVVFSWIGLMKFEDDRQKNKWMAVVGLILGGVYCLISLDAHGHFK